MTVAQISDRVWLLRGLGLDERAVSAALNTRCTIAGGYGYRLGAPLEPIVGENDRVCCYCGVIQPRYVFFHAGNPREISSCCADCYRHNHYVWNGANGRGETKTFLGFVGPAPGATATAREIAARRHQQVLDCHPDGTVWPLAVDLITRLDIIAACWDDCRDAGGPAMPRLAATLAAALSGPEIRGTLLDLRLAVEQWRAGRLLSSAVRWKLETALDELAGARSEVA